MSNQLESGRYKVPFKRQTRNTLSDIYNKLNSIFQKLNLLHQRLDSGDIRQSLMAHGMDIADIKAKLKIGDLESEIVKQDMDKPHYEDSIAGQYRKFRESTLRESQDDDFSHSSPLGKQGGGYVMKSDVNRVIDEVFYSSALYKNSIGSDAKQALLEAISKL